MQARQALASLLHPNRTILNFPTCPIPSMHRVVFLCNTVSVWAWPSRGGLIVLECVTPVDLDFLGLDLIRLRLERDPDQDAEDRLCQQLLRLGAKWFDSPERYQFASGVFEEDERCVDDLVIQDAIKEPVEIRMLIRSTSKWRTLLS
jgi:hypothetical protein